MLTSILSNNKNDFKDGLYVIGYHRGSGSGHAKNIFIYTYDNKKYYFEMEHQAATMNADEAPWERLNYVMISGRENIQIDVAADEAGNHSIGLGFPENIRRSCFFLFCRPKAGNLPASPSAIVIKKGDVNIKEVPIKSPTYGISLDVVDMVSP